MYKKDKRKVPFHHEFHDRTALCFTVHLSALYHVGSLHTPGALGQIIGNGLTLFQSLEAFALDSGEMYEYIRAVLTGDKSIAFFCVEPLYCTFVHHGTSISIMKFVSIIGNKTFTNYRL